MYLSIYIYIYIYIYMSVCVGGGDSMILSIYDSSMTPLYYQ